MGEDRVAFADKNGDVLCSRQRHSSVISSCSEDAETESTSTGYPLEDEEKEEELEYGPGIVNKLKTRFLSITLKQNRGTNMRRSCSMENLLDQERPSRNTMFSPNKLNANGKEAKEHRNSVWGNLKRAKSMDTLLMDLQPEPPQSSMHSEMNGDIKREPKIVRRLDGGLLRLGPTICDEELPKPDTVKIYKRMFEPAESRRGSYSRRPPVLRASAKSGSLSVSKINVSSSAKMNGTASKSKLCAKQSPVKAQPDSELISSNNGSNNQPLLNGEDSKPMCNGNYVKAIPVKIMDNSVCNGKIEKSVEKKINILNHNMSKKDAQHQNGNICNGNSIHKERIKTETIEELLKPGVKKLVNQTNKVVNGGVNPVSNSVNGIKTKPKVPPNRPAFIKNVRQGIKVNELNGIDKKKNLTPKMKSNPLVASKNITDSSTPEINNKIEESINTESMLNGDVKELKSPKVKNDNKTVEENNLKNTEKVSSEAPTVEQMDSSDSAILAPVKEPEKEVNGHVKEDTVDTEKPTSHSKWNSPENKSESKPVKKQQQQTSEAITTSMVFDFRGKDVVPHVAVLPTPFGCKALHPRKRPLLIDGKEAPNGKGVVSDEEDEYHMDYSVPPPSGVIFEGENVKIGKGSILFTRNKDLKIQFDDNVDENTFVYPSESSLLEDEEQHQQSLSPTPAPSTEMIPNGQPPAPSRLKSNLAIGSSGAGGLSTYTPSVLRTVDNFEPGMFRPLPAPPSSGKEEQHRASGEEENTEVRREDTQEEDGDESQEGEMLKPADPGIISSWSLSAGTSDLLF